MTLIDFGNAGKIKSKIRDYIIAIYLKTLAVDNRTDDILDTTIYDLSEVLRDFVLYYNESQTHQKSIRSELIKSYFRTCFNPKVKINDKIFESRKLMSTFR